MFLKIDEGASKYYQSIYIVQHKLHNQSKQNVSYCPSVG